MFTILRAIGRALGCFVGLHEWSDTWTAEGKTYRCCLMASCQRFEVFGKKGWEQVELF